MHRIGKYFLLTAFLFSVAGSPLAWAHGDHFHSLAELSAHIDGHVARLEAKLASGELAENDITRECRELIVHAKQYQRLARTLIRKGESVEEAKALDAVSDVLMTFARKDDLLTSLDIMRQIQILLRPVS